MNKKLAMTALGLALFGGMSAYAVAQIADDTLTNERPPKSAMEAGEAAYLAGISLSDAILSPPGQLGWRSAERHWRNGQRLAATDILHRHPDQWQSWSEATRLGYRSAVGVQCAVTA
jgi:hypothetical protein